MPVCFFFKSIMPNIKHNIKIICEIHIAYRYIDPSNRHNFENCLLPWYTNQSCLGWPLAAWLAQTALREKSWKDNFQSYGLTIQSIWFFLKNQYLTCKLNSMFQYRRFCEYLYKSSGKISYTITFLIFWVYWIMAKGLKCTLFILWIYLFILLGWNLKILKVCHSFIRGVLIQSCSTRVTNFTQYVFFLLFYNIIAVTSASTTTFITIIITTATSTFRRNYVSMHSVIIASCTSIVIC